MTARRRVRPQPARQPVAGSRVVRVLPAEVAIDKEFDYLAGDSPSSSAVGVATVGVATLEVGTLEVGTMVRVDLAGRRVAGWVVGTWEAAPGETRAGNGGRALRPLALVSGWGPEPELVELAGWAAWRWAGRRAHLLATASPQHVVRSLPAPALRPPAPPAPSSIPAELATALAAPGGTPGVQEAAPFVLRIPPATDLTAVVAGIAQRGPTLVIVPEVDRGVVLAGRLRRGGADVAVLPGEWAQARAGAGVVVGARAAAWAPCPGLAAVVVIDGHDPALVQEQAPTWSAVGVAAERARRAGVPCVVVSACPTVELLAGSRLLRIAPDAERAGWSEIDVVDRRSDDPRLGLYSERVVEAVRSEGIVLCVLNRTGRARLLACAACGAIADCERCGAAVTSLVAEELTCPRCGFSRPVVCRSCTSTRLRQLRIGVSRAREELEALAGRPVGEITASGATAGDADVVVGTEAVLHRRGRADVVVFLDFDQHLLGARLRAPEEALALLARASRLAGGRLSRGQGAGGQAAGARRGRVLVQTRLPDHPVLQAAAVADPARLTDHEAAIRAELRFPPFGALAAVSGAGAAELVAAVAARPESAIPLDVLGPDRDRWLLRASDHAALADALAGLDRPAARVRVEVDPQRI